MSTEDAPQFHRGGLVLSPGGGDTVPVWFDRRCEHIFTAEQVKRMRAARSRFAALTEQRDKGDPA